MANLPSLNMQKKSGEIVLYLDSRDIFLVVFQILVGKAFLRGKLKVNTTFHLNSNIP